MEQSNIIELKELFTSFINPLKRISIFFIIFLVIGMFLSNNIIDLFKSFLPDGIILVAFSPVEVFVSVLTIITGFAIVFTFPYFLFEVIRFISPALFKHERNALFKIVPISLVLFVIGTIFGVSIMAFFGLIFFSEFALSYGIPNMWSLSGLVGTMVTIGVGFGFAFQLPLVIVFLVKQRLVGISKLKEIRLYVVLFLLVVSAFLTPPDVVSQILMALPLYLLYEGSIWYLGVFCCK